VSGIDARSPSNSWAYSIKWWHRRGKLQIHPWARSPVATHGLIGQGVESPGVRCRRLPFSRWFGGNPVNQSHNHLLSVTSCGRGLYRCALFAVIGARHSDFDAPHGNMRLCQRNTRNKRKETAGAMSLSFPPSSRFRLFRVFRWLPIPRQEEARWEPNAPIR
jgi:hypothetical protein